MMLVRPQSHRIALTVWIMAWLWPGSAPGAAGEKLTASSYFILDNGLQVLLQEKHDLPLTGMALAIDLGSKDETEVTSGYAHLLEHMLLFGGGAGMDSETRLAELRRHGIAHNAHTDFDLMTFEISCPADESAWALAHLRQTVFFSQMDPRQLESEKRIIGEEILQLRDDPAYLGRLLVMQQLFAGHAYGQPVYGDGSTMLAATVERLQAFCAPLLVPGRCVLSVVGDFSLAEMEKEVRRNWGGLARGEARAAVIPLARRLEKNHEEQIELDVHESHLFFGWYGPDFNDEQRLPLSLLVHILGRGLNPLLNVFLRVRRQLAQQIDMSYIPFRSGGMILLHLTLEKKDIRSAKNELARCLSMISSFNFSREDFRLQDQTRIFDYLQSVKNQMAYNSESFRESALNLSVASARFLLLDRHSLGGSYHENVERMNSTDLRRAAGKYLSGKKCVVVAITPLTGEKK
jgi:predicted Zn-dependent peptidase